MALKVETFTGGPLTTNAYLVFDDETKQMLIIDAPQGIEKPLGDRVAELGGEVVLVVLTHSHWDHIGAIELLHQRFSAPIAAHPLAQKLLANPDMTGVPEGMEIPAVFPDRWLDDGDLVPLGAHQFVVMHLPGHSPEHIGLYSETDRILLSGDVLFPKGHGRTDIPGASDQAMMSSLKRLAALPDDVTVYPGHGAPTTIGAESWLKDLKG